MSVKFQTFADKSITILHLATRNFDSSLRLLICLFVPNSEAIGHVNLVLGPKNRPESLA